MRHIFFIFALVFASFSFSQFEEGLELFKNKKFKKAITAFSEDFDSTKNINSLYNIGICKDTLGKFEEALFYFEKTLKFDPNFGDAIYNAIVVQEKIDIDTVWQHPYSWFERFIYKLNSNSWSLLAIIMSIIVGLCLYLIIAKKKVKIAGPSLLIGTLILTLSIIGGNLTQKHESNIEFAYPIKKKTKLYINQGGIESDEEVTRNKRYKVVSETEAFLKIEISKNAYSWIAKENVRSF